MDEGKIYVNVKFAKNDPQSASNDDMGRERPGRRKRSDSSIWLICVLTAALIITGICWRIHVSQIRQSQVTSDRSHNEGNSTLQSKLTELNSDPSDLKRMHSDLRHQFTEMETKYRSVNETKAQICEWLTSRREQRCSEGWVTKKDRCYYLSTFVIDYMKAMQECANRDSRLLQIKASDEEIYLSHSLLDGTHTYWIGKCETGNVGWRFLYKMSSGEPSCSKCGGTYTCNRDRRFICEKPAPVVPDVPVKIQGLCQQPVEAT